MRKVAKVWKSGRRGAGRKAKAVEFILGEAKAEIGRKTGFVPSDDLVEILSGDAEDGGDVEIEENDLATDEAGMWSESILFHTKGSAACNTDKCNTGGSQG